MKRALPAVSLLALLVAWAVASALAGPALMPWPWDVAATLGGLLSTAEFWWQVAVTLARAACGLAVALALAFLLGVPAGLSPTVMRLAGPLVAALQSCPPIVWITLLLVWAGSGNATPITVVAATVFPPLFANIAQGCMSLDPRLFAMARFYAVPGPVKLARLVLPGLAPYVLAGLSYALASSWKVAAVAEFLGSGNGLGARIYWAYRMLEMEQLFAYTLVVVIAGVALEAGLVAPLRTWAAGSGAAVKSMPDNAEGRAQ